MKKEDLRVRKTKANLYKGILKLLEKKSFEKISITDICKTAMINRSTFYDHYNDKYELLASILDEFKKDYESSFKITHTYKHNKQYLIELAKQLIEFLEQNKIKYKTLLLIQNNKPIIEQNIFEVSYKELIRILKETNQMKQLENITLFYCSGIIKMAMTAINNTHFDKQTFLKEIEQIISTIDTI